MSLPRKLKATTLLKRADTEKKRETLFMAKRRILRQMHKEGFITEAEAQEQYIALDVMLRLIKDPTTRPELRFLCAKELWPHEAMTLAEEARLDAMGDGGPVQISISIAPWAAGPDYQLPAPAPRAIEAAVVDVSEGARGRNSLPSPPLDDRERLRAAAAAAREVVVMDVPPEPSAKPVVVARVGPMRGIVKTPSPEDVLRKKFGRDLMHYDESTPDTSVVTDDKIFGR